MTLPVLVHAVPAFADNYLWVLSRGSEAAVVDPGDGEVVAQFLDREKLSLTAIVVTHHHGDHIGGIDTLRTRWNVPVYGPRAEHEQIGTLNVLLGDGDTVEVLGETYAVLAMPGHTLGHIAYHCAAADDGAGRLFCGDTLFSAGCGRLFEGTAAQLHQSLQRLAALPASTRFYCAHEYTASNLAFARAVDGDNPDVIARSAEVQALRAQQIPTVPATIGDERRYNPFLRAAEPALRASAERHAGHALADATAVFAALRTWKDGFRA